MIRRVLVVSLITLWAGCVPVHAWQRGNLSHPCLDPEDGGRTSMRGFHDHTNDVREGFSPCMSGQAGGGCGCN